MVLDLFVRFITSPGQQVFVYGNTPLLGNGRMNAALRMSFFDREHWHIQLTISDSQQHSNTYLQYGFIAKDGEGNSFLDGAAERILDLTTMPSASVLVNAWNSMGAIDHVFATAPFKRVFYQHKQPIQPMAYPKTRFRFSVAAPSILPNERLAVVGSAVGLGNWLTTASIAMHFDGSMWYADVEENDLTPGTEYKYCIVDSQAKSIRYEEGENRILGNPIGQSSFVWLQDGFVRSAQTVWKGAGVAIPVFSLRTKKSMGTGDFIDLIKCIDWAARVNLKMIQLLPVQDTTCTHTYADAYPYAAVSAFALHPLYASIEAIAGRKYSSLITHFLLQGKALNAKPSLDYPAVLKLKREALSVLYTEMAEPTFEKKAYKKFFNENRHWLEPYAAYHFLRDRYKTSDWSTWGKFASYSDAAIEVLVKKGSRSYPNIAVHYFIQFYLHLQFKKAHDYANSKGVILKGDVAIGVHRYSVDAWKNPSLFHLTMQAGAPPDDFAVKGQNWGFPTYNWINMQQDGYTWWKQRLQQFSLYVDALRLDHVLGFFRIWSIPDHAREGIMGRFVPSLPIDKQKCIALGVDVDENRFTQPYITDAVLEELAGEHASLTKPFLERIAPDRYVFTPIFSTQEKIEHFFSGLKNTLTNQGLKIILFDLHSNVLLWKDPDQRDAYHFRFNAIHTTSYRFLDTNQQLQLKAFYGDYFYNQQEFLWKNEALVKLSALKFFSNLLICGEDLGLLPSSVSGVLSSLGLLSLEVQRMPKQFGTLFADLRLAPYLSVVTPSTHDMSTLRLWWLENQEHTQKFYTDVLRQHGTAPQEADANIIDMIVQQHLSSPAMWSLFQLQDLLALNDQLKSTDPVAERINIPADPKHYWCYRMHVHMEDLIKNDTFNDGLAYSIKSNGR